MDDRPKTFLEELQSLEEPTKQKILVVATIIIMIIIIYFWLAYFNGIVSSTSQSAIVVAQNQPVAAAGSSGPGFWGNMANGAAKVYQSISGGIHWFGSAFGAPKQYIIQGSQ